EILGYNTIFGPFASSSTSVYEICATNPAVHVASELWDYALGEWALGYNQANPDKALEFVKTLDYAGTDGMYIFPKTYEPYYQDTGKSIEFYKGMNASWGDWKPYFSSISDFNPDTFTDCNTGAIATETTINNYLSVTQDNAAIVNVNGLRKWICHDQDKWWLAPACRNSPLSCVPMITNSFWSYNPSRQKATVYNIAMAIANT
ncbi:unnamed protein product, partial [Symbiodinium pilosum]